MNKFLKRLEEELKTATDAIEIEKGTTLELHEDCLRIRILIADYYNLPETLSNRAWKKLKLRLQQISRVPFLKSDVEEEVDQRLATFKELHYLLMDIPRDAPPEHILTCLQYMHEKMEKHHLNI